ncbi:ISAs1 family transposase [Neorhodopirellula pilleata]|uniref:ISAs1 family transposase n=1 Tax=Neorhodopirellula pilleata TaxID=2714738 RepID=UPI0036F2C792
MNGFVSQGYNGVCDVDGPSFVISTVKTARGSYTDADNSDALHIVSAWATEHGLTLGQVAVDSKSNEIIAIPELLDTLGLTGTIAKLDALGSQKSIAAKIIDGGGDYTFAVKDNHPKLASLIEEAFRDAHEFGTVASGFRSKSSQEKGHGRIEERTYCVASVPESMRTVVVNTGERWRN